MKKTGAEIILDSLVAHGVHTVFGYPGGACLPLYDALYHYQDRIDHILVRHEQGAAFAADGFARASGDVGVCIATSGPGVTNLVTGIAGAHMDSVPVVAITGQVPRNLLGTDGFQETDATGVMLPITKHNWLVMHAEELPRVMEEAFYVANTGRPGPVQVDVPKDVFLEEVEFDGFPPPNIPGYNPEEGMQPDPTLVREAAEVIHGSEKPIILAGHGIHYSRAYDELLAFAEKANIPVITTLHGVSSFPESHDLSFGMVGMHGNIYANWAVDRADLLISLGMRFDDRVTGRLADFATGARIIHVDIDPAEIGKNVTTDVGIVADLKPTIRALIDEIDRLDHSPWVKQVCQWREEHPSLAIRETEIVLPQWVIRQIYHITKGDAVVVTDVGQAQMWAAQHFWYDRRNTFFSSGGLGAMGYAFPASIGVKFARPNEQVWCIIGDGGFQMTLQDLAVVKEHNVDVKIAIINNSHLGMIRQWQTLFYDGRFMSAKLENPDFVKLAEAYGITGLRATTKDDVVKVLKEAQRTPGPVLLDLVVDEAEKVYPMVPAGSSLAETIESDEVEETRYA